MAIVHFQFPQNYVAFVTRLPVNDWSAIQATLPDACRVDFTVPPSLIHRFIHWRTLDQFIPMEFGAVNLCNSIQGSIYELLF